MLSGCLLHIRGLCELASSSLNGAGVGSSAISLVRLDSFSMLTLEQFVESQQAQRELAWTGLALLRDTVVSLVLESCTVFDTFRFFAYC